MRAHGNQEGHEEGKAGDEAQPLARSHDEDQAEEDGPEEGRPEEEGAPGQESRLGKEEEGRRLDPALAGRAKAGAQSCREARAESAEAQERAETQERARSHAERTHTDAQGRPPLRSSRAPRSEICCRAACPERERRERPALFPRWAKESERRSRRRTRRRGGREGDDRRRCGRRVARSGGARRRRRAVRRNDGRTR